MSSSSTREETPSQPTSIGHNGTSGVGDERSAVEGDEAVVTVLLSDTVAGHHGDVVGLILTSTHLAYSRVTLHRASPVTAAVDAAVLRLGADGGRIHCLSSQPRSLTDHLSAHESHDTSSLGEPLIPADGDSELAVLGVPHLEAGVTGVEVELLLVAGTIGNVGLSVDTEDLTVSVDDSDRVVVGLVVLLEERDGKHDRQLLGDLLEVSNQSAGGGRLSVGEGRLLLVLLVTHVPFPHLAEIPSSEELLEKNDLSTLGSGLTDELLALGDVLLPNLTSAQVSPSLPTCRTSE